MQEDPPTFIPMIEETQEAPIQTQASRREQGLEGFRVFAQDIDNWNSAEEEIYMEEDNKGCHKKNFTSSKFKSVIFQEPNVLGGCPSHSL